MLDFEEYDLCILGSGPAGFAGAMRAMDLGKSVCLIEKESVGGAGVAWGALASKCLWELSKDYSGAAQTNRGYRASGLTVDFAEVMKTVQQAVKEKQYQMLSQIESYHPNKGKAGSITYIRGTATFEDAHTVRVYTSEGEKVVRSEFVLIATGSRPREFPGIPCDHERILNSNSIFNLKKFPERILIVGAGIIGCEFATIFSNFKQSEVYLLDHANQIIPFEDDDISNFIDNNLANNGVNIIHKAKLRQVNKFDTHLEAIIDFQEGHSKVIEVDHVLMSIGRIPNTDRICLEKAGIEANSRGALKANNLVHVKDNVYCAGDVSDAPNLVNVGEMQARYSVKCMFGEKAEPPVYEGMSTIMFFKPEVAAVGLNEKKCRELGIPYKVAWYSNALVNRAISMRAKTGFVKILMANDGSEQILGMRAAGPQASSLVMCITMMMDHSIHISDIIKTIHPHPSMTEGVQECIRVLLDRPIYKPDVFPEFIKVRSWNGKSA